MPQDANLRTIVYVDAFNLYFGSLRKTAYRWLNLDALCNFYLAQNKITNIKYFTAKVKARPNDPQQPSRQQAYLRALNTLPNVSIIYGHYLSHEVMARLANPNPGSSAYARIIKTEEKGSDVNIATHMMHDAHLDRFDVAVVISNDSDLQEPIKLVRSDLGKKVGILNPQKKASRALLPHVDFIKQIRPGALQASQFPPQLTDGNGHTVKKPPSW